MSHGPEIRIWRDEWELKKRPGTERQRESSFKEKQPYGCRLIL